MIFVTYIWYRSCCVATCAGAVATGKMPQFTRSPPPGYYLAGHMKDATRNSSEVNENGLNPANASNPRFFNSHEFATLSAACARLIPQPDREQFLGIARAIDYRL